MWLTRQLFKEPVSSGAEPGNVTLSGSGAVAASGSAEVRNIPMYGPSGFSYLPASGEQVLLLPCGSKVVCAGSLVQTNGLQAGEIRLYSAGGAAITLKNNGDAEINGVKVSPDGSIYVKDIHII